MSAIEALRAARAADVELSIDGDDLVLAAAAPPPPDIIERLSCDKAGILKLLRPGLDGWSSEDWQIFFDERAGIAESVGGLSRPKAEAQAFKCCVVELMNRTFERSGPEHCLACGGGDRAYDVLLPHGVEPTGHVWLHSRCWPAWHAGRKAEAVAALEAMGIVLRPKFPDDFGKNRGAWWAASDRDGRADRGAARWKPAGRST